MATHKATFQHYHISTHVHSTKFHIPDIPRTPHHHYNRDLFRKSDVVHIKDWILIRTLRSNGQPAVTHMLFGTIQQDDTHTYMPGETILKSGITDIGQGIARTMANEFFKFAGPGRRVEIPTEMLGEVHDMTRQDWDRYIQGQKQTS